MSIHSYTVRDCLRRRRPSNESKSIKRKNWGMHVVSWKRATWSNLRFTSSFFSHIICIFIVVKKDKERSPVPLLPGWALPLLNVHYVSDPSRMITAARGRFVTTPRCNDKKQLTRPFFFGIKRSTAPFHVYIFASIWSTRKDPLHTIEI